MSSQKDDLNLRDFLKNIIKDDLESFRMLTKWGNKEEKEFKELLANLKRPYDRKTESTKEKGDRLENLVEFIIRNSFFFEIYRNITTETNEIDSIIVFSDQGKQALEKFGFSRELIPIPENIFLGECKNYEKSLNVTYVGKFYSLMSTVSVPFGILFTKNGLTGKSEGYKDAYGLAKVLRMVEQAKNPTRDFYIITFTLTDYENMAKGVSFFDLVAAKKLELQTASNYTRFIETNRHSAESKVKDVLAELS